MKPSAVLSTAVFLLWAILFAAFWSVPVALSHEWYPYNCCSGFDCRAVSQDDLSATDKGWLVKSSGEVVPYGDQRIKATPPEGGGLFHLCTEGGRADGRVICIYIPNFGG